MTAPSPVIKRAPSNSVCARTGTATLRKAITRKTTENHLLRCDMEVLRVGSLSPPIATFIFSRKKLTGNRTQAYRSFYNQSKQCPLRWLPMVVKFFFACLVFSLLATLVVSVPAHVYGFS